MFHVFHGVSYIFVPRLSCSIALMYARADKTWNTWNSNDCKGIERGTRHGTQHGTDVEQSCQHPPEAPFKPRPFPVSISLPAQCPQTAPDAVLIGLRPLLLLLPDAMEKHIVY